MVTEFSLPTAGSYPLDIVNGGNGTLVFTEYYGNNIGRITSTGAVTEFPLPTPNAQPYGIVHQGTGTFWFTENSANKIGEVKIA